MNVKYRVELSQSERDQLEALLGGGRHAARKLKRAQILLAANDGVNDAMIAATLSSAGGPKRWLFCTKIGMTSPGLANSAR